MSSRNHNTGGTMYTLSTNSQLNIGQRYKLLTNIHTYKTSHSLRDIPRAGRSGLTRRSRSCSRRQRRDRAGPAAGPALLAGPGPPARARTTGAASGPPRAAAPGARGPRPTRRAGTRPRPRGAQGRGRAARGCCVRAAGAARAAAARPTGSCPVAETPPARGCRRPWGGAARAGRAAAARPRTGSGAAARRGPRRR